MWSDDQIRQLDRLAFQRVAAFEDASRTLMWSNGKTPIGFTVMKPAEEQLLLEEMQVLAMQEQAQIAPGDTGRKIIEHPAVKQRIAEMSTQADQATQQVQETTDRAGMMQPF